MSPRRTSSTRAAPATSYSITLLGNVTGPRAVAPFPDADLSYPNGAIVSFSGKFYVFAGGRAFRLQNASALAAVEKVDHAEAEAAPAGTRPASRSPTARDPHFTRPVDGTATIYVAGTMANFTASPLPSSSSTTAMTRLWSSPCPTSGNSALAPRPAPKGPPATPSPIVPMAPWWPPQAPTTCLPVVGPSVSLPRPSWLPSAERQGPHPERSGRSAHRIRRAGQRRAPERFGHGVRELPGRSLPLQVHRSTTRQWLRGHRRPDLASHGGAPGRDRLQQTVEPQPTRNLCSTRKP